MSISSVCGNRTRNWSSSLEWQRLMLTKRSVRTSFKATTSSSSFSFSSSNSHQSQLNLVLDDVCFLFLFHFCLYLLALCRYDSVQDLRQIWSSTPPLLVRVAAELWCPTWSELHSVGSLGNLSAGPGWAAKCKAFSVLCSRVRGALHLVEPFSVLC